MNLTDLTHAQWILTALCALLIGFSKTGLSGASILIIPIMADIFGGKNSSGIILPMLVFADFIAVGKYRVHTQWKHIIKLMPWALGGIVLGLFVGNVINDLVFKRIIAIIILAGLAIMIRQMTKKSIHVPTKWYFAASLGLAGGFTTMIGNAAGPVMAIYLLSMKLPKYSFIGTGAWFFMIINLVKLPLQYFVWKGITLHTLTLNAMMIPVIILGTIIGVVVVKKIPELPFKIAIILLAAVSAVKLLM